MNYMVYSTEMRKRICAGISFESAMEFSIYSTKEIPAGQITIEDQKAARYADQFDVGYDGNGLS
ncbi:hypothetical protein [Paenibacillus sp. MMO-58]|uniref:hypothetical protein n=1 Tax=Paenibacillus sp. MMO-58 TaxID=3081290 RepID=UPI00301A7052